MLTMFFADAASAQERPLNNEFAVWFVDQFASAHAFSEETNGSIYQVETRYTRMILARELIASGTLPTWSHGPWSAPLTVRMVRSGMPMALAGAL